jgi:hypothetical protein
MYKTLVITLLSSPLPLCNTHLRPPKQEANYIFPKYTSQLLSNLYDAVSTALVTSAV